MWAHISRTGTEIPQQECLSCNSSSYSRSACQAGDKPAVASWVTRRGHGFVADAITSW